MCIRDRASLVRKLEELGIGLPSTYAPTISTVQQRGYVEKGHSEGVKRPYDLSLIHISDSQYMGRANSLAARVEALMPMRLGTSSPKIRVR